MGQCQSRNVTAEQHLPEKGKLSSSSSANVSNHSPMRVFRNRHDKSNSESPTTPGTAKTISPSDNTESTLDSSDLSESDHGLNLLSVLSSPSNQKLATFPEEEETEEDDDMDEDGGSHHNYDYGAGTPSLLFHDDFESAIPEEEDPDAPSDEEDFHITPKWREKDGPLVASTMAGRPGARVLPLTTSPPRTQASVKLRKGRVTNPQSIVHRPEPPLVAPNEVQNSIEIARNAVKPHTLAEFNRLKVQVKLANRQEKVKTRAAKLEDRYEDVRGYKGLWNDYEKIERKLSEDGGSESGTPSSDGHKLKRSTSFDLKDADTWFIDFQSIDGSEGEEDTESQCHLSLLSESSMEAQRLLFAEKSAERYRKAEQAKMERRKSRQTKKESEDGRIDECDGEEKKAEETPRSQDGAAAQQQQLPVLTTPRDLFRTKTGDDDSVSTSSKASSYSQSHKRSSGRDYGPARSYLQESPAITNMEVSFSGQRLVRTDSDFDDNTSQLSVDVEDYNDYHVPRRRRRHHNNGDDESATSGITSNISYDEERMELASATDGDDMYGLDSLSLPSSEAAIEAELNPPSAKATRESPPKSTFGAPYLDRSEPRWREFSNVKEQVLMNNAAKCLRDVSSTKALLSAESENDDVAYADDEEKLIQIMTTDEFFRMSNGMANPVAPPIRLHLPTDKVEKRQTVSEYRAILTKVGDYGPAREYSPKKSTSPLKGSPSRSSVDSLSDERSGEVNHVLSRIRDADNKGSTGEDYYRYEPKSPSKRSPPVKDDTPLDEPGAIVMGVGKRDVYSLRNVLSASPDSPAERYKV